jgi:DNA-binding transcriptional MerR regulator
MPVPNSTGTWLMQRLIRPAARAGGRRHYDPSVLQRLASIALLQEAGFTIAEVGKSPGKGTSQQRWRPMAEHKLQDIQAHMARVAVAKKLLIAALQCDCSRLDKYELVSARLGRHQRWFRASRRPHRRLVRSATL